MTTDGLSYDTKATAHKTKIILIKGYPWRFIRDYTALFHCIVTFVTGVQEGNKGVGTEFCTEFSPVSFLGGGTLYSTLKPDSSYSLTAFEYRQLLAVLLHTLP